MGWCAVSGRLREVRAMDSSRSRGEESVVSLAGRSAVSAVVFLAPHLVTVQPPSVTVQPLPVTLSRGRCLTPNRHRFPPNRCLLPSNGRGYSPTATGQPPTVELDVVCPSTFFSPS